MNDKKVYDKVNIYYLTDQTGVPRYVGKTIKDLNKRLNGHKSDNAKNHRTNWIKSVGKENIKIVLIEVCDYCIWIEREKYYIEEYKRLYKLTNDTFGGEGVDGRVLSDETKQKMSLSAKGKKMSDESRKKMSESKRGYKHNQKSKDNMAKSQIGRKASEETKIKLSTIKTGIHPTEETKKKMSESKKGNKNMLGKTHTEESRKKISESLKGRIAWNKGLKGVTKFTDETKQKMSDKGKGRKMSDESRKKMSEAAKNRYKKNIII